MVYPKSIRIIPDVKPGSVIKHIHDIYIMGGAAHGNFIFCQAM